MMYSQQLFAQDNKDVEIETMVSYAVINICIFYSRPAHRSPMTPGQKFCTNCGTGLVPGMKFCGQCGTAVPGVTSPVTAPASPVSATPATGTRPAAGEGVVGIVPFVEQGLISVIHYTLVVTSRRLIFCTWDPKTDEAMSDADDEVMQESCSIEETADEITHFRAKDWSVGPWQKYRSMAPDSIVASSMGTIVVPIQEIESVDILCETRTSTQDSLYVIHGQKEHTFDLMYSQGPFLFGILEPILGERVSMVDHKHRRSKIDRLITGQEYK